MSQRSIFEIAALASAAMPELSVWTTRGSEQFMSAGDREDITTAIIKDNSGNEFDVSVSSTDEGKALLKSRARAAYVLDNTKEPAGIGFSLDSMTAFVPGTDPNGSTGLTAVLIMPHAEGYSTPLSELTENQCIAAGTAIGAIHRMRGQFIVNAKYPAFSAQDIRQQLEYWIINLESAGHIPHEITANWKEIAATEGLWSFQSCPVHGGFRDGDILFSSIGVVGIHHWEDMQFNDPARDLSWIFTQLDSKRRSTVLTAYSRIMGSRLDDMIMLRAGLWVQMAQVGDFLRALDRADTAKILQFKSQVESLAHQIAQANPDARDENSSTLTVGDLLENRGGTHGPHVAKRADSPSTPAPVSVSQNSTLRESAENEDDATNSAVIAHAHTYGAPKPEIAHARLHDHRSEDGSGPQTHFVVDSGTRTIVTQPKAQQTESSNPEDSGFASHMPVNANEQAHSTDKSATSHTHWDAEPAESMSFSLGTIPAAPQRSPQRSLVNDETTISMPAQTPVEAKFGKDFVEYVHEDAIEGYGHEFDDEDDDNTGESVIAANSHAVLNSSSNAASSKNSPSLPQAQSESFETLPVHNPPAIYNEDGTETAIFAANQPSKIKRR